MPVLAKRLLAVDLMRKFACRGAHGLELQELLAYQVARTHSIAGADLSRARPFTPTPHPGPKSTI